MKKAIEQLKIDIVDIKARYSEALKDIKRIEKDIHDFSKNKDSKLAELQSSLESLKKNQTKNLITVKTLQKELQESRLESEQSAGDLGAAQEQLTEAESTLKAQEEEILALNKEQAVIKVCYLFEELPSSH